MRQRHRIFFFDFSRDGKQISLSHGKVTSDVVLIGNFKGIVRLIRKEIV
jgi:hypothetical protein